SRRRRTVRECPHRPVPAGSPGNACLAAGAGDRARACLAGGRRGKPVRAGPRGTRPGAFAVRHLPAAGEHHAAGHGGAAGPVRRRGRGTHQLRASAVPGGDACAGRQRARTAGPVTAAGPAAPATRRRAGRGTMRAWPDPWNVMHCRMLSLALCLVAVGAALPPPVAAAPAAAQSPDTAESEARPHYDTGDAWIDARLADIDRYATHYPEAFAAEV